MSDKVRFPLAVARVVAEKIALELAPACERVEIAGSIRRRKEQVGDIEILYIPRQIDVLDPTDMFGRTVRGNAADIAIEQMIARGSLAKRPNKLGRQSWGAENKFAVAVKAGIPVDLFSTTRQAWFNYLVCRTGSAASNTRIAAAAQKMGYTWHPTSYGFEQRFASEPAQWDGSSWTALGSIYVRIESERGVFEFVGLKYLEPWERS